MCWLKQLARIDIKISVMIFIFLNLTELKQKYDLELWWGGDDGR